MIKTYRVNEWFFSLQGEGMRAGTPNLFVRFSGCNLNCNQKEDGFNCDTEFTSGKNWTLDQIVQSLKELSSDCRWVVLTGGEPSLQIDDDLVDRLHAENFKIAIETNGTRAISQKIDWITVSPKGAEHCLEQRKAHELKYVRAHGMGIPKPLVQADHYLISPAFEGDVLPEKNLSWCIDLVKNNPGWRLSLQQHKFMRIR